MKGLILLLLLMLIVAIVVGVAMASSEWDRKRDRAHRRPQGEWEVNVVNGHVTIDRQGENPVSIARVEGIGPEAQDRLYEAISEAEDEARARNYALKSISRN